MPARGQRPEDTSPDVVNPTPEVHASFRDLALETIDAYGEVEDSVTSRDSIFVPLEADARKSYNKLKRSITTQGERDLLHTVGEYVLQIKACHIMRDIPGNDCGLMRANRTKALRAAKDAVVMKNQ